MITNIILLIKITGLLFLLGVIKVLLRTNPEIALGILLSSAAGIALYWNYMKDK